MPDLPIFDFSFFLPTYVPAVKNFVLDNKSLQEKMIQAFLRKSVEKMIVVSKVNIFILTS